MPELPIETPYGLLLHSTQADMVRGVVYDAGTVTVEQFGQAGMVRIDLTLDDLRALVAYLEQASTPPEPWPRFALRENPFLALDDTIPTEER